MKDHELFIVAAVLALGTSGGCDEARVPKAADTEQAPVVEVVGDCEGSDLGPNATYIPEYECPVHQDDVKGGAGPAN